MASSPSSEEKMITLKSNDNETFSVKQSIAVKSVTIRNLIDDDCASTAIPLPNVTATTLALVIEYLNMHKDDDAVYRTAEAKAAVKDFDKEFAKKEMHLLFDLILAANFLNIQSLLELMAMGVANRIQDKSVEEVREIFNITGDFTPEEESKIRAEHEWAFN